MIIAHMRFNLDYKTVRRTGNAYPLRAGSRNMHSIDRAYDSLAKGTFITVNHFEKTIRVYDPRL